MTRFILTTVDCRGAATPLHPGTGWGLKPVNPKPEKIPTIRTGRGGIEFTSGYSAALVQHTYWILNAISDLMPNLSPEKTNHYARILATYPPIP